MGDATPTGAGPLRVLRILFRIVFALALVVLLVLIGIKQAPAVLAAIAPATPTTTVAAGLPTTAAGSTAPAVSTPIPTISVPTVTVPPVTGGGGTGSGGGTASTKPTTPRPVVTSLSAANVVCPLQPSDAPGATSVPTPQVTVSWSTSGGTKAWFGIQTSDAEANPYAEEPLVRQRHAELALRRGAAAVHGDGGGAGREDVALDHRAEHGAVG